MGLLHIYCGDGKGKTTAALGLAIRAVGSGKRVHIVQLMKGTPTSELITLENIPSITVERCDKNYGFTFNMTNEDKLLITECHNRLLKSALNIIGSGATDMLILDEFNVAYSHGLLDKDVADGLVLKRPESIELVLTGRNPDDRFIGAADYVSEIRCIKHPYQNGVSARKGIEY